MFAVVEGVEYTWNGQRFGKADRVHPGVGPGVGRRSGLLLQPSGVTVSRMRVITWRSRSWRAEEYLDGWRLSHGNPRAGYALMLDRATLDQVTAHLLAKDIDPVADVDEEPRRPR